MKDRDKTIFQKILKYCEEVNSAHEFFENDKDLFFNREQGFIYRNAVNMPILQIGELVGNLTDEIKTQFSDMPWAQIKGIRNLYAHKYGTLDYNIAWDTSKNDVTELKTYIEKILAS